MSKRNENMMLTAVVVAAGLAGLAWLKKNQTGTELKNGVFDINLKIAGIHPGEEPGTLNVDLLIRNVNKVVFKVQSLFAQALVNGQEIGRVDMWGHYDLPGNSEQIIPLTLMIRKQSAVKELIHLFQHMGGKINFVGHIEIDGKKFPLDLKHTI